MDTELEPEGNPVLNRGDIVVLSSDGIVGWMIRKIEGRQTHGRAYVNHVAFVTRGGRIFDTPDRCALILDAQPPTITEEQLQKYEGDLAAVFRPRTVTTPTLNKIVTFAETHYLGHHYGVGKILLHLLGLQRFAYIDRYPICSWTVAMPMYIVMAWMFGCPAGEATPESIFDFGRTRPDQYEEMRALSILERPRLRA